MAATPPKSQVTPWVTETEPETGKQFRTRTNAEGKPEYQNLAGETIEAPRGAIRTPKTETVAVATKRDTDTIASANLARQARQDGKTLTPEQEKAIEDEPAARARIAAQGEASGIKSAAAEPAVTPEQRQSRAAMVAAGDPLIQVIPGFGQAGIRERQEAQNDAIDLIRKDNPEMTAADAGRELSKRQILYAAQKSSSLQLDKMLGATQQAVSQLDFNIEKTKEEMKKLGSTDLSPILNAIARGEEKWTGDPAYSSLFFFMQATAMESARILQSGQASVAQLHQGAADEARKWANENMTPASFNAVAEAMHVEGQKRIQTYQAALNLQTQMPGGKKSDNLAPPTINSRPAWVPPEAVQNDKGQWIAKQPNGKWHVITPLGGQ